MAHAPVPILLDIRNQFNPAVAHKWELPEVSWLIQLVQIYC
jgi:hypothetical protein